MLRGGIRRSIFQKGVPMKSRFYFCLLLIVLLSGLTAAPVAAQYGGPSKSRPSPRDEVDDDVFFGFDAVSAEEDEDNADEEFPDDDMDEVDEELDEDDMESLDMEDEGSPEPEYAYPPAWKFAENRRPQVQAEERVRALKRFSLDFYKRLIDDENKENQNVVCSPWSAAMILCMLHDGANEETAKEIRKALRFQGNSKFFEKYLHMVAYNARGKLPQSSFQDAAILDLANSFWRQDGYEFREKYLNLLEQRFLAEVSGVDFTGDPSEIAKKINAWCSEKTGGNINEFVSSQDIGPQRRMMILNAVYFKGRWGFVFSRRATKSEWFHHADGTVSKTPMMNLQEEMNFYNDGQFSAIRKPYCGNAHMLIILPHEHAGLAELEKRLSPQFLKRIDNQFEYELVKIKLPRFSFDSGDDLIPVMEKLNVVSAFDADKADFSKMTDEEGFFIDVFRQKAIIRVDEEGTVAAAATGGWGVGGRPPEPKKFYADRPFLFLIRENTDNGILFMGRVHHPEKIADTENAE